ncbi:uncharacterized protein LOC110035262 [Phalaenopsis equestris]|uniref:uncharacterized protein LOC110035262 n=1 Tax=Phalaenopsis equestris TaxID=78828 RepID=UPI0009E62A29|nr:uncharacterized protein LOC110035262 [Phalaenopsis equestris]
MDALTRSGYSASLAYKPPCCRRPAVPLLTTPFSLPFLPPCRIHSDSSPPPPALSPSVSSGKEDCSSDAEVGRERMLKRKGEKTRGGEIILHSINPNALLFFAALPGSEVVRSVFGPFVEVVKTWNLPEWLVHWGHPGNMVSSTFHFLCIYLYTT